MIGKIEVLCDRCKNKTDIYIYRGHNKHCAWCGHQLIFKIEPENIEVRRGMLVQFDVQDCCIGVSVNGIVSDLLFSDENVLEAIQVGGVWIRHQWGDVREWIATDIREH